MAPLASLCLRTKTENPEGKPLTKSSEGSRMRLLPLQAVVLKQRGKTGTTNKPEKCQPQRRRPLGSHSLTPLSPHTHPSYPLQSRRGAEAPSRGASTQPAGPGEGRRTRAGAGRQGPLPALGGVASGCGAAGAAPLKAGAFAVPASPSVGTGAQVEMGGGAWGRALGRWQGGAEAGALGGGGRMPGLCRGPCVWGGRARGEEGEAVPAVLARGR